MTREELVDKVIDVLRTIQVISGRPVATITEETKPIGDLVGFDSLNGVELAAILNVVGPKGSLVNVCVSPDGRHALSVEQISEYILQVSESGKGEQE